LRLVLYAAPNLWHLSRVRFAVLPILVLLALALGGCTSPEKRAQKQIANMEKEVKVQNSRATEERRMREMAGGYAGSKRGAEVIVWDPDKEFNMKQINNGGGKTFATAEQAQTKQFYYDQKTRPGKYETGAYTGNKANTAADKKFASNDAKLKGKFEIPNSDKKAPVSAVPVNELRDANKIAASRALWDGERPYKGKESTKLNHAIEAKELADWRSGGGETVNYANGTVERLGTIKQLSIDEVRELLNKNK
jgi:hypothetical protein